LGGWGNTSHHGIILYVLISVVVVGGGEAESLTAGSSCVFSPACVEGVS